MPLQLEAETGKLFPVADRAGVVLDALLTAYVQRGGRMPAERVVSRIAAQADGWRVQLGRGRRSRRVASCWRPAGFRCLPRAATAGSAHRAYLGHSLVPTYPALVPLTGSNPAHQALAGVSLRGGPGQP